MPSKYASTNNLPDPCLRHRIARTANVRLTIQIGWSRTSPLDILREMCYPRARGQSIGRSAIMLMLTTYLTLTHIHIYGI